MFALLWIAYVFTAVAGSVLWLATAGRYTATGYGPAARIMLIVLMAGVVLVWPMTRLSQLRPAKSGRAAGGLGGGVLTSVLLDVWVVLLPVQLVIWPLLYIASWPMRVIGPVAVVFVLWTLVAGGVQAIALTSGKPDVDRNGRPRSAGRTLAMLVLVVASMSAPAAIGVLGASTPSWVMMLSPFTSLPALTGTGLSGPPGPVSPEQRLALTGLGALVAGLWGWAGFRAVLVSERELA